MSFLEWLVAIPAAFLFLYVAARVVSAAVLKSKQDHDEAMRRSVPR